MTNVLSFRDHSEANQALKYLDYGYCGESRVKTE